MILSLAAPTNATDLPGTITRTQLPLGGNALTTSTTALVELQENDTIYLMGRALDADTLTINPSFGVSIFATRVDDLPQPPSPTLTGNGFSFDINTTDGNFIVGTSKSDASLAGISAQWNIYVDGVLYGESPYTVTSAYNNATAGVALSSLSNGEHAITIESATPTNGWLVPLGFYGQTANAAKIVYCNSKISKTSIAASSTAIANGALDSLFRGATNLVLGNKFCFAPSCDDFLSVGSYFANRMFFGCVALTTLPADFNLPQNITMVASNFTNGMFENCASLTALPTGFNFPKNITTVGSSFASAIFFGCTSLTTLPIGFNIPQNITTAEDNFVASMFRSCSSLTVLPTGFNLPQNITTVGDHFVERIFQGCTILTALPIGFNLPQNISTAGDWFAFDMFYECSTLATLPTGFNLPQNITAIGDNFARSMFGYCTNLTELPSAFNLPQSITTTNAANFAYLMFTQCTQLVVNSAFKFNPNISGGNAYYWTFYSITASQIVTATSIINGTPTPSIPCRAFYVATGFSDYGDLPENWK
jgi:hypothetical protein